MFLGVFPRMAFWEFDTHACSLLDYAVVYYDGKPHLFNVPPDHQTDISATIDQYVAWANKAQPLKSFTSVCMSEDLSDFAAGDAAKWMAGVVHIPVNDTGGTDWIAWFGREQLAHVDWGVRSFCSLIVLMVEIWTDFFNFFRGCRERKTRQLIMILKRRLLNRERVSRLGRRLSRGIVGLGMSLCVGIL